MPLKSFSGSILGSVWLIYGGAGLFEVDGKDFYLEKIPKSIKKSLSSLDTLPLKVRTQTLKE